MLACALSYVGLVFGVLGFLEARRTPRRERTKYTQLGYVLSLVGIGIQTLLIAVVMIFLITMKREPKAHEPVGSTSPASLLTRTGDPDLPLPTSFAGFRFGDLPGDVSRKCRVAGHASHEDLHEGDFARVRCDGVPGAEPTIDGESVSLGLCKGAVCDITVEAYEGPATVYRKALDAVTKKYGKPFEIVSSPPENEEAVRRTCTGTATIARTTWEWGEGVSGQLAVELSCVEGRAYASIAVTDSLGVAHYRHEADASVTSDE